MLFGLFMVLTFTGTLSVTTAGRDDVRNMLIAAIGCNTAWGFVDAVMYVLRNLVARGRKAHLVRQVRGQPSSPQAHRVDRQELGPLPKALGDEELERVRHWLVDRPAPPRRMRASRDDLRGALGVFLLVFARPSRWCCPSSS